MASLNSTCLPFDLLERFECDLPLELGKLEESVDTAVGADNFRERRRETSGEEQAAEADPVGEVREFRRLTKSQPPEQD